MPRPLAVLLVVFLLCAASLRPAGSGEDDPSAAWRKPLGPEEMAAFNTALEAANLTMDDFSFQRRIEQPFTLPTVARMIDEPLYCAELADEVSRRLFRAAIRPHEALACLVPMLEAGFSDLSFTDDPALARRLLPDAFQGDERRDALAALRRAERELPTPLADSFAVLFLAASTASRLVETALSDLTGEERAALLAVMPTVYGETDPAFVPGWKAPDGLSLLSVLKAADKADLGALAAAAAVLSRAVRAEADRLSSLDLSSALSDPVRISTPLGDFLFGPPTDDTYTRYAPFVVETGGDDCYRFPAATALMPAPGAIAPAGRAVSFLLDLHGDDRYLPPSGWGCGFALGGAAVLLDASGSDTYRCGALSVGAGLVGVGVFIEGAGDDLYFGDDFSQGAGFFGIGLLAESSGSDIYRSTRFSQGFAGVKGIGALTDDAGVDDYFAGGKYPHVPLLPNDYQSLSQGFGYGLRNTAAGGIGILCDASGKDTYTADVFGQGAAYWIAGGILVDGSGNDVYTTTQYAQGGGIHLAAGILLDRAGRDHYYSRYGVGMGGGHDLAVGILIDQDGTDFYQGSGITQGGAHANGIGLFFDCGTGSDGYSGIGDFLQGKSSQDRGTAGIAVFVDMGGDDTYSTGLQNGELRVRGVYGVAYDVPGPEKEVKK